MADFATAQARSTLTRVIRAIESRTEAELVIAVRHKSGPYFAADLMFGIFGGIVTLACLIYLPVSFGLHAFLFDPIAIGLLFTIASSRLDPVRRWLMPAGVRARWVCTSARATFFERGVYRSRTATGVLLYIAVLERRLEVVADCGVARAVPAHAWTEAVEQLQRRFAKGVDAAGLVAPIEALGELLATWLPCEREAEELRASSADPLASDGEARRASC